MRLTVSFASSGFLMQRGATRRGKQQLAQAIATSGLSSTHTDIDALLAFIQRGGIYFPATLKAPALKQQGQEQEDTPTASQTALVQPTLVQPTLVHRVAPTVENFLYSNLVVLDFDNNNPGEPTLSWQQALEHPYILQHACFLHESPNFTPNQNRFRVGFILPKQIDNYHAWQDIAKRIAEHFPAQYDIIRNPTWGFAGCRVRTIAGKNRITVLGNKEFARLTQGLIMQTTKGEHKNKTAYHNDTIASVSFEEAEQMLSFVPEHLDYTTWQAIVFGIANTFEQHEAEQLVESWSPGRDNLYSKLIARTQRKKHTGAVLSTIATVIHEAKKYGYVPPKNLYKHHENNHLVFDHTLQVNRWVAEAKEKLISIINNNHKTLLVSRTNNGKSTFVESLATNRRVLLISPLSKLTEQQAEKLHKHKAVSVTGGEDPTIAELYFKHYNFVCTTPEMLLVHADCIEAFDVVVIDEIHELRRMDYRPKALLAYHHVLNRARKVLALTATLTDNIFRDEGFTTVLLKDNRNDVLDIIAQEFPNHEDDQTGSTGNKSSLEQLVQQAACACIEQHLLNNKSTNTQQETDEQQKNAKAETQPGILVLRIQSKNIIDTVQTYCSDVLKLHSKHLAILTSDTKDSTAFEFLTAHQRFDDDIAVVLTTSVADIGIDVLNTNIDRLVMFQPQDETEVIQFAARFRRLNIPIECFYKSSQRKEQPTEPQEKKYTPKPSMQWLYHKQVEDTNLVVTFLNAQRQLQHRGLHPKRTTSPFKAYNLCIAEQQNNYLTDTLMIAAKLYKETAGKQHDYPLFFENLQQRYHYCRLHFGRNNTESSKEQQEQTAQTKHCLQQIVQQKKQKKKKREDVLLQLLKEQTDTLLLQVFSAHKHDKALRHSIVKEWEGLRRVEDATQKALREDLQAHFGSNIFAESFAAVVVRRYLQLRRLLLSPQDAARIVAQYKSPTAWYKTIMALEVQRRQFLLREAPEQLPQKWKNEAEAIAMVAETFCKQGTVESKQVQQRINALVQKTVLYMPKREAALLATILFGKFKRRGKEKTCYYDCQRVSSLSDTLVQLGIEPVGYIHTLRTHIGMARAIESSYIERPAFGSSSLDKQATGSVPEGSSVAVAEAMLVDSEVDSE